jgi:hypothetical protein
MTVQSCSSTERVSRGLQGEKALMWSRVDLSEVQINGIPMANMPEVTSTT